jgi:ribbon-helix-helix CopG family protein
LQERRQRFVVTTTAKYVRNEYGNRERWRVQSKPKPSAPPIVVRIPQPMLESIDRLAQRQFMTRAEALRAMLRSQLAEDDGEEAAVA